MTEKEKYDMTDKDDMEKLKEKMSEEAKIVTFKASRVPKWVSDAIKDHAEENCCDDYGWALADMVRAHQRENKRDRDLEAISKRIDTIEDKVNALVEEVSNTSRDNNKINTVNS